MKNIKTFETFVSESSDYESNKYNTVSKIVKEIGRHPSVKEVALFVYDNFEAVTGEELGKKEEKDPTNSDKIADLISFLRFDLDEWTSAWEAVSSDNL